MLSRRWDYMQDWFTALGCLLLDYILQWLSVRSHCKQRAHIKYRSI